MSRVSCAVLSYLFYIEYCVYVNPNFPTCPSPSYPMVTIVFLSEIFYLCIFGCAGSLLLLRLLSSCGQQGLLFVAVLRLLTAVASLVEKRLWGSWALAAVHVGSVVVVPRL